MEGPPPSIVAAEIFPAASPSASSLVAKEGSPPTHRDVSSNDKQSQWQERRGFGRSEVGFSAEAHLLVTKAKGKEELAPSALEETLRTLEDELLVITRWVQDELVTAAEGASQVAALLEGKLPSPLERSETTAVLIVLKRWVSEELLSREAVAVARDRLLQSLVTACRVGSEPAVLPIISARSSPSPGQVVGPQVDGRCASRSEVGSEGRSEGKRSLLLGKLQEAHARVQEELSPKGSDNRPSSRLSSTSAALPQSPSISLPADQAVQITSAAPRCGGGNSVLHTDGAELDALLAQVKANFISTPLSAPNLRQRLRSLLISSQHHPLPAPHSPLCRRRCPHPITHHAPDSSIL